MGYLACCSAAALAAVVASQQWRHRPRWAEGCSRRRKLSFSVRADNLQSFDAFASFKAGRLSIGYLRSYEGQASARVQVCIPCKQDKNTNIALHAISGATRRGW